MEQGLIYKQLY